MKQLLTKIKNCTECEAHLPMGARPVVHVSASSKIMVIGQAPGIRVHNSGIPWNDPSGDNLRNWLDVDREQFYDESLFGIMPMGFCYPGTGKSGDLPPRKECAKLWHKPLWDAMPNIQLTLLIGKYAQDYYLGKSAKSNLTNTVRSFDEYLPKYFVLPHPSPRNNIWQKKNPWFKAELLPDLKKVVGSILNS